MLREMFDAVGDAGGFHTPREHLAHSSGVKNILVETRITTVHTFPP